MEFDSGLDKEYENNAVKLLHNQLSKLTSQSQDLCKTLKGEKERLERLSSQLHLTKQQIDFFTQEIHRALEGIKDANWQFTKEVCNELGKIKNPTNTLLEVCDKFMLMLDQKDRSWKTFRAITKNYSPLRSLMSSVQAENLSDEQVNELLPIWKRQQQIQAKLQKVSKGAQIIAEWICYSVEYKLKKETLTSSKRKLPELEKKVKSQVSKIAELNAQILILEEQISEVKINIDNSAKEDESEDVEEELSVISMRSTNLSVKPQREEKVVSFAQETFSQEVMQRQQKESFSELPIENSFHKEPHILIDTPRFVESKFPNFNLMSEDLYGEEPKNSRQDEEHEDIIYEDHAELFGCCRSRFFCF